MVIFRARTRSRLAWLYLEPGLGVGVHMYLWVRPGFGMSRFGAWARIGGHDMG